MRLDLRAVTLHVNTARVATRSPTMRIASYAASALGTHLV